MTRKVPVFRTLMAVVTMATFLEVAIAQALGPPARAETSPLTFLVADVHVLANSKATHVNLATVNHDRLLLHHATMVDMITLAYGIDRSKVFGGPSWLDNDRYEVAAWRLATLLSNMCRMLQGLLTERFKLVLRTEDKPLPAYLLTAPKGIAGIKSRMKQSDGSKTPGCTSPQLPPNSRPAPDAPVTFACSNESMKDFAAFMGKFVQWSQVPPVVDSTGVSGSFDFYIQLPTTEPRNSPETTALLKAVESIGLAMVPGTSPQPATVVVSANETPTPNPPGIEAAMPRLPSPELDVATVKPAPPGDRPWFPSPDDMISFRGLTLRTLISYAWQLNSNAIANAPKWLDEEKFDISARVTAPDNPAGGNSAPAFDGEQVPLMIRKLLEERFVIKSHMEDRSQDAFALLADNPKMKVANPEERSGCKEGPGPDGKDPRADKPVLGRLISCQKTTMAQFAEVLEQRSNGYLKMSVFDATGLPGTYDFTLSFSGYSQVGGINAYTLPSQSAGDGSNLSDPTGGLLLFTALKQQLGLKLEKQKHVLPMLVLDHINEKPTEN